MREWGFLLVSVVCTILVQVNPLFLAPAIICLVLQAIMFNEDNDDPY
jgi:hypothetical protein